MNIAEFLLVRIAEDEAEAQAVVPPGRAYTDGPLHWSVSGQSIGDATGYLVAYDIPAAAPRDHIARHDPARVLRECAAKRAIIESCTAVDGWQDEYAVGLRDDTLQSLAAVYSDHSDYQQKWSL